MLCALRRLSLITILSISSFLFVENAQAKILWKQDINGSTSNGDVYHQCPVYGNPRPCTDPAGIIDGIYAVEMSTSTNSTICSIKFKAQWIPTSDFRLQKTEGVNIYIKGISGSIGNVSLDQGTDIYFGHISSTDLINPYTLYDFSVTSTNCIQTQNSDITKRYFFVFKPDWGNSTSTDEIGIVTTANSNTSTSRLSSIQYNYYTGWQYWGNDNGSHYYGQSPLMTVYGSSTVGFNLGNPFPYQSTSNASTSALFYQWCDQGQDFGWWQPLISGLVYLACPDQSVVSKFNTNWLSLMTRIPIGYFTSVKTIFDSQTSASTVHFTLSFRPPYNTLATSSIDLTQSYLDVPLDIRNFAKTWVSRIAWLALLIYLVVRAIYFFK